MPYLAHPIRPILPKRLALTPGIRLSQYMQSRGLGRYRGLGQDYSESSDPAAAIASAGTIPSTTPVSVSGPGFNWAGTIGGLLNSWTQIASNVIAPRNTITTGPQGTSVNLAAGSTLPAGALLTPSLAGATSPLLWIAGGGILLFLFAQMGKGR